MPRLIHFTLLIAGMFCAATAAPAVGRAIPAGARYVAMGSSFAAGPGVTNSADTPPNRCGRSVDNYAHQFARKRRLELIDVTCSGATTAHLLGPWGDIPPQLDALTADTRLVTITIGGNDIGYIGGLIAASCRHDANAAGDSRCPRPLPPLPTEAAWAALDASLRRIAGEARRRAPAARIIFIEYPVVLPDRRPCADTPLTAEQAAAGRAIAARLAALTAQVARTTGNEALRMSTRSRGHDACAAAPWMAGFPRPGGPPVVAPYHPNLAGMKATAAALDRQLRD